MIGYNRHNTLWLSILGAAIGVVLLSGAAAPLVQATLVTLFVLALAGSFLDLSARARLMENLQQASPLARSRMSATAREAIARANNRGGYLPEALTLADIGMIAAQSGSGGLNMRVTRTISKDDDAVRPFVKLLVDPTAADRSATVRFEVIDQNGREQYIHEMKVFLREGEFNILADHHLPLMKNPQVEGMGEWDLRVSIDGHLAGVHNFTLEPSSEERRTRLGSASAGRYYVTESRGEDDADEEAPVSLEDLLRSQDQSRRSGR